MNLLWIALCQMFSLMLFSKVVLLEDKDKPSNVVLKSSETAVLRCRSKNNKAVYWRHGNNLELLNGGLQVFKNFSDDYEILHGHSTQTWDMKIKRANKKHAVAYFCDKSMNEIYGAHVVVVDENITCEIKSSTSIQSQTEIILEGKDDEITINCSFIFYAEKHCVAYPMWYDIIKNKEILGSEDGIRFGVHNGHLWLIHKKLSQIEGNTRFDLSVGFKCFATSSNFNARYAENIPVYKSGFITPVFQFKSGLVKDTDNMLINVAVTFLAVVGVVVITYLILKTCRSLSLKHETYQTMVLRNSDNTNQYLQLTSIQKERQNNITERPLSAYEEVEDVQDGYDTINDEMYIADNQRKL